MSRTAIYRTRWCAGAIQAGALLAGLLVAGAAAAEGDQAATVHVTLGDYRFKPAEITLTAGQPAVLELENVDGITPHNFTLTNDAAGLDVDVNVPAGSSRRVTLTPSVVGTYPFYCNKKLPFMKSHRDRGMQGRIMVVPVN